MTSLTQEQRKWLDKCTTINGIKGRWTLNSKTGLVDVEEDFNCSKQGLSDFKGVKFGVVGGYFCCANNRLTSLVGAPQSVGEKSKGHGAVNGYFFCSYNQLTTLVGAPQKVKGHFYCDYNPVSSKTLKTMFSKMNKGDSFWVAATSLKNKMSKKNWKLIASNIPEAIQPGVNMLARFGVFK